MPATVTFVFPGNGVQSSSDRSRLKPLRCSKPASVSLVPSITNN